MSGTRNDSMGVDLLFKWSVYDLLSYFCVQCVLTVESYACGFLSLRIKWYRISGWFCSYGDKNV